jgi:hypothetical protein
MKMSSSAKSLKCVRNYRNNLFVRENDGENYFGGSAAALAERLVAVNV